MARADARVGRVGFAAHLRGGGCDGGSPGGFLLEPRGRLDSPTGRCGTQERPRRRMLLYAHLARYRGRGRCRPVWPDLSPSVTPQRSRPLADPTSTQPSSATSRAARSFTCLITSSFERHRFRTAGTHGGHPYVILAELVPAKAGSGNPPLAVGGGGGGLPARAV